MATKYLRLYTDSTIKLCLCTMESYKSFSVVECSSCVYKFSQLLTPKDYN